MQLGGDNHLLLELDALFQFKGHERVDVAARAQIANEGIRFGLKAMMMIRPGG